MNSNLGREENETDLQMLVSHHLHDRTRRKLQRLVEDLNLEISSMPVGLRNSFRIIRDMAIEILDE